MTLAICRLVRIATLLLCVGATVSATQKEEPPPVVNVITSTGQHRGGTSARPQPYTYGRRVPLSIYLVGEHERSVKDGDGEVVSGLGFYAWRSTVGAPVVVRVFLLVPAVGQPNAFMAGSASPVGRVRPKDFASYSLKSGEKVSIDQMKTLGLAPFYLVLDTTGRPGQYPQP